MSHLVTVTDEDNRSHVELDFSSRSPSPSSVVSDQDDDSFNENYLDRRTRSQFYYDIKRHTQRSPSPPKSDSGYSNSTRSMKGFVVGSPESNIYGNQSPAKARITDDDQTTRSNSRMSRDVSPIERPNWGFGPSRVPSRMEEGFVNGYDSDQSMEDRNYRLSRAPTRGDDGYESASRGRHRSEPRRGLSRENSNLGMGAPGGKQANGYIRSKYKADLDNYRATKINLYKNGDPWFGSMEYRFVLGREFNNLDGLFNEVSSKMDFINGIAYMFDTEGTRITSIDQIVDGCSYVCSQNRRFVPANYGQTGDAFALDGGASARSTSRLRRISYNKKTTNSAPTGGNKPGSGDGRVIKIVNADDHHINERVLLNLKTTQPFEDVVNDLGQVLKIRNAIRLYTKEGQEIRGFSHLRNDFQNEDTFIVSAKSGKYRYFSDGDEDDVSLNGGKEGLSRMKKHSLSESSLDHRGRGIAQVGSRSRSTSRGNSDITVVGAIEPIRMQVGGNKVNVYPPTMGYRENLRPPNEELKLDWIYGYRGRDTTENLWLLDSGEILYFIGTFAVIFDPQTEAQRYYTEHSEDITCMSLHPTKEFAVSGQRAGSTSETKAHIRIWKIDSLETQQVLGMGECDHGICAVAFSTLNNGAHVTVVDQNKESTLSVWEWSKRDLLGRTATNQRVIIGCAFHPLDNNLIITYGKSHLVFWNRRKDGFFERSDVVKDSRTIKCITFLESGDLVAGDDDGMISTYSVSNEGEYYRSSKFEAHERGGGVNCLLMLSDTLMISGGDRDHKVISWEVTRDFEKLVETKLPDSMGAPRTIIPQKKDKPGGETNLYVGTTNNNIVEGSLEQKFGVLVWGHRGELHALAVHPDDFAFVTAGLEDKTVAKWKKQKVVWKLSLGSGAKSAIFHPRGSVVVVGTDDGHLLALNGDNGSHIITVRVCASSLNAVGFSRDGTTLATASQNGTIYLYKASPDGHAYKKYGKMVSAVGIRSLDFNRTGELLQTVSKDYDLSYWNLKTNRSEPYGPAFRDEEWLDQTATVGYGIAGAWQNVNYRNDPTILCSHVGSNRALVAVGDNMGYIRIFRYPSTTPRAEFHEEKPSAGPVTNVRFMFDDIYLISASGEDTILVRWKVF